MAELKVTLDDDQIRALIAEVAKGLTGWMPARKFLPHQYQHVLVSTTEGIDIAYFFFDGEDDGDLTWKSNIKTYNGEDVVAWMKLPKPYKEEKDE